MGGIHAELFQRWQYTADLFRLITLWAAKPWPDGAAQWPTYLDCLELPLKIEEIQTDNILESLISSHYPDPYSVKVFWIQSLIHHAQLKEQDITAIMSAITAPNHSTSIANDNA